MACVTTLQALSGCAKGLTSNSDLLDLHTSPESEAASDAIAVARTDPRLIDLRRKVVEVLTLTMSIWSADAEVGEVRVGPFRPFHYLIYTLHLSGRQ